MLFNHDVKVIEQWNFFAPLVKFFTICTSHLMPMNIRKRFGRIRKFHFTRVINMDDASSLMHTCI